MHFRHSARLRLAYILMIAFTLAGTLPFARPGAAAAEPAALNLPITAAAPAPQPVAPPTSSMTLTPPEQCAVPRKAMLGQDLEVYVSGAAATYAYAAAPRWLSPSRLAASSEAKLALASLNSDTVWAVTRAQGAVQPYKWNAVAARWVAEPMLVGMTVVGDPAIVSLGADSLAVAARNNVNSIKVMIYRATQGFSQWQEIPGVNAGGSFALASRGADHMLLAYTDAETDNLRVSEWTSGKGWQEAPRDLGQGYDSAITALVRDEFHLSLFGVRGGALIARDWDPEGDWSEPRTLATNVPNQEIAAVSRHPQDMLIAWRDNGRAIHTRNWTGLNDWLPTATTGGEGDVVELTSQDAGAVSLLTLSQVGGDGQLWERLLIDDTWHPWQHRQSGWSAAGGLSAASRKPGDILIVGKNGAGAIQSSQYTARNAPPTLSLQRFRENVPWPNRQAFVQTGALTRGQPSQTRVFNLRSSSVSGWLMELVDPQTGASVHGPRVVATQARFDASPGSAELTAADLDGDGLDEVLVASYNSATFDVYLSRINPLTLEVMQSAWAGTMPEIIKDDPDINIAFGDLDGDGKQREVVVAAHTSGSNRKLWLYQYDPVLNRLVMRHSDSARVYAGDSAHSDFDIAIGQIDADARSDSQGATLPPRAQLIVADQGYYKNTFGIIPRRQFVVAQLQTYRWAKTNNVWQIERQGALGKFALDAPLGHHPAESKGVAKGEFSLSLKVGDVDADLLDEIVLQEGNTIRVISARGGSQLTEIAQGRDSVIESRVHALTVGDIDMDGRADIVGGNSSGQLYVYKLVRNGADADLELAETSFLPISDQTVYPLVGDVNNDSDLVELLGCSLNRKDVRITAVVNAPPRPFKDNQPVTNGGSSYGTSQYNSTGGSTAVSTSVGGSVTIGVGGGGTIPVIGIKVGEFSMTQTFGFMATLSAEFAGGVSFETSQSHAIDEVDPDTGQLQDAGGLVVYTETTKNCYTYQFYRKGTATNRMLACTPASQPAEKVASVRDWNSPEHRELLGLSWARVGHASSDLASAQRDSIPADRQKRVIWNNRRMPRTRLHVGPTTTGTGRQDWNIAKSRDFEQSTSLELESSYTLETEAEISGLIVGGSFTIAATAGAGYSVGWGKSLELGGSVYNYNPVLCPACRPYSLVPYVYEETATTEGGASYSYLAADYYVMPSQRDLPAAASVAPAAPAAAPAAPVITSGTHPAPATWATTSTAQLAWSQPAGDQAAVAGYRWALGDQAAASLQAAGTDARTSFTYGGLADGIHRFAIQAIGADGLASPVAEREVRVDTTPPTARIMTDPPLSNNLGGWQNTPLQVSVIATDTPGSGVAAVEYSLNGSDWQPYVAPAVYDTDTLTTTVWARATDGVGAVSEPVSVTFKIDLTVPDSLDGDGYGLSYGRVITGTDGNEQFVLGGALNDALSGRGYMDISTDAGGVWQAVTNVGEFPMLPGNVFTDTTVTALNWVYTPTIEYRGQYDLVGRGVDVAGNQEAAYPLGTITWYPDETPDLIESGISINPPAPAPGDRVEVIVAARNTGSQEARLDVISSIPAGLTPLPGSLSDGGSYDAATREISWTLEVLWPGETRYLTFDATADAGASGRLVSQVELAPYWPGLSEPGLGLPVTVISDSVSIQPTASRAAQGTIGRVRKPRLFSSKILEGDVVDSGQVSVFVDTEPTVKFLLIKEHTWDTAGARWVERQNSGWVPFSDSPTFDVTGEADHLYGTYRWNLTPEDGVKYLSVWVADANRLASNLNESGLIYTNLMGAAGQSVAAGERIQYRLKLQPNDLAIFNLVLLGGDADVSVWNPRNGFYPNHLGQPGFSSPEFSIDTAAFYAPEAGTYLIEVEGVADISQFRLAPAGDAGSVADLGATADIALDSRGRGRLVAYEAGLADQALVARAPAAGSIRRARPLTISTPYSVSPQPDETFPVLARDVFVYLPLLLR